MDQDLSKKETSNEISNIGVEDSLESLFNSKKDDDSVLGVEEKSKISEISDISEAVPLKIIRIRPAALRKMFILAQEAFKVAKHPVEVYSLSIGENDVITDILIPKQHISYASVQIDFQYLLELIPIIRERNLTIVGWNHSHANFGVFFSGTDHQNQNVLLADTANFSDLNGERVKFVYGMTVNVYEAVYGEVTTQFSNGNVINTKASFEFIGGLPKNWNEKEERSKIAKELKEKIQGHSIFFRSKKRKISSEDFQVKNYSEKY